MACRALSHFTKWTCSCDSAITKFRPVREVEVINSTLMQYTMWMFCTMGLPCKHMLCITNVVRKSMCNVRWARQYLFQFASYKVIAANAMTWENESASNTFICTTTQLSPVYPSLFLTHLMPKGTQCCYCISSPNLLHSITVFPIWHVVWLKCRKKEVAFTQPTVDVQEEIILSPRCLQLPFSSPLSDAEDEEYDISFDGTMKICKKIFNIVRNHNKSYMSYTLKLHHCRRLFEVMMTFYLCHLP